MIKKKAPRLRSGLIFSLIFSTIYILMHIKAYNISMLLATMIAWFGFFVIINNFDPTQANWIVFLLFYGVLFLAVLGTLALLGFWLRQLWNRQRGVIQIMATESFRQSIILAAVLVLALWLQALRVLTWWNILILVLLASVIEFVFLFWRRDAVKKLSN